MASHQPASRFTFTPVFDSNGIGEVPLEDLVEAGIDEDGEASLTPATPAQRRRRRPRRRNRRREIGPHGTELYFIRCHGIAFDHRHQESQPTDHP